jgi:hypothetical protein
MTRQTTAFLTEIVELRDKYSQGGTWIFGAKVGPTVLDAHVVPFIARLRDISLEELVPPQLRGYAERILASAEWKEVMGQRATVWDPSMGPINELRM